MTNEIIQPSRRGLLKCMGYGGAGTLLLLSGGVVTPVSLAEAATTRATGLPLFLQISDTHIGFKLDANPDVAGTLNQTIALVNAMPQRPALTLHTGDITHLSKPEEFDLAQQLLSGLKAGDLHTVPGEHDMIDSSHTEYLARFGQPGAKGWYSFDQQGVHFVGLNNVIGYKLNTPCSLGDEQMAWLEADLKARSASTPIVLFAHMPLWSVYDPWGWGSSDADRIAGLLKRFGSVTVLNGHIHQIVQKVEGNITYHTARSTAFPQALPGVGPGPGPLKVPADQLPGMLGLTSVTVKKMASVITDTALG